MGVRFLATTPKHPVIRKALKEFQSWYRVFFTPGQDQDGIFDKIDGSPGEIRVFFFFKVDGVFLGLLLLGTWGHCPWEKGKKQ